MIDCPDICTGLSVVFSHHNITCITSADLSVSLQTKTPRPHFPEPILTPPSISFAPCVPCRCIIVTTQCFCSKYQTGSTVESLSSPTMAPETQQHFTEIHCDKASRLSPPGRRRMHLGSVPSSMRTTIKVLIIVTGGGMHAYIGAVLPCRTITVM